MQQEGFNRASQYRGCATIVGRNTFGHRRGALRSHVTVLKPVLYADARCLIRFR
jgi:hypothetical protein